MDRCASICAAFDDCAFFWIYDNGGCCLKSSYDAAAALAAGGVRTGMPGDYYKLTARGPAPPPYVPPPIGQGTRNGDDYACSANSWAGRNPTDTTTKRPRTIRFKDKDSVASKRAFARARHVCCARSLRNAPGSVSQVGHAIVESMQSEDPGVDPDDPHAGLTEAEYQELMSSLEVALVVRAQRHRPSSSLPPSHTRAVIHAQ